MADGSENRSGTRPFISIVIPNWNGAAYLERCLRSLQAQTRRCAQILIVDDGSTDASVETVTRIAPEAEVIRHKRNLGFAAAVNSGIRAARGEWVALLNNDTEAAPDWLAECAAGIARHPGVAFLACRILDINRRGHIYSAGDCFLRAGLGYRRGQELPDREAYREECEIFSACGCAAVYRKSALDQVHGFDERFFAYFEDVDLGLRLQAAGCRGVYISSAVVRHHGGATTGGEFSTLATRLRTRNSVLLLLKSTPGPILCRCLPMIAAAQLSWLVRASVHGRLLSYVKGMLGVFPLAAAMMNDRRQLRPLWREGCGRLWEQILKSETLARQDYAAISAGGESPSAFLRWYFRTFRVP